MSDGSGRYLFRFFAVLAGLVLLAWAYALALPMAFMPSGYAAWMAKSQMLDTCTVGQIAFLGDSRVEAGVIPADLPVESSNLAIPNGTAIEIASAVRRILACPTLPRQVLIALTAEHFGPLTRFFWDGTLRYGILSPAELWDAKRLAASLGDTDSFNESRNPAEVPPGLRDWVYGLRFPTIYFSNFVQGRLFARYAENQSLLAAAWQRRGYYAPPDRALGGLEPPYPDFRPLPLQTTLFERSLRDLVARGVGVGLLIMPVSPAGAPSVPLEQHHQIYLQSVAQRIPVRLVSSHMPHWPARLFSDASHMNNAGAALFTARLAACVVGGSIQAGCDLDVADDRAPAGTPVTSNQAVAP